MYVTMSQSADLKPQIILESKVSAYFHRVRCLSDIIMKSYYKHRRSDNLQYSKAENVCLQETKAN